MIIFWDYTSLVFETIHLQFYHSVYFDKWTEQLSFSLMTIIFYRKRLDYYFNDGRHWICCTNKTFILSTKLLIFSTFSRYLLFSHWSITNFYIINGHSLFRLVYTHDDTYILMFNVCIPQSVIRWSRYAVYVKNILSKLHFIPPMS